jgi:hypothetical protein
VFVTVLGQKVSALAGRAELPARVEIAREEMTSFVVSAREGMDRLRRNPVYLRGGYDERGAYTGAIAGERCFDRTGNSVPGAREVFRTFLDEMAVLGSRACDRLFQSEDGQVLRAALDEHLRPGDLIQIAIDRNAAEFVWPWAWLYGKTIDPSHRFRADANLFWGYRFVIEQIAGLGDFDGGGPLSSELPANPLRVKIGCWNFEPETKSQIE